MSEELKACPFCGFEKPHFMEEGHWIYMACESCGCGGPVSTQMRDPGDTWNTRPIEDALRAELAASQAEVKRLRKQRDTAKATLSRLREVIRKAEWGKSVHTAWDKYQRCAICGNKQSSGHDVNCPFYQWEGGEK